MEANYTPEKSKLKYLCFLTDVDVLLVSVYAFREASIYANFFTSLDRRRPLSKTAVKISQRPRGLFWETNISGSQLTCSAAASLILLLDITILQDAKRKYSNLCDFWQCRLLVQSGGVQEIGRNVCKWFTRISILKSCLFTCRSGVFTFLCDEFVQIKNSDYFLFGYSHVTLSPHRKAIQYAFPASPYTMSLSI